MFLLLLGIVTAVAVPAWQRLVADNRLSVAANTLVLNLQRARSEALKRNTVVFVCPGDSRNGCGEAGDWNQGWRIAVDTDRNGRAEPGEAVISEASVPSHTLLRASRRSTPIAFRQDGRSPGSNTTWIVCDPHGSARSRYIVLSNEGRIRTDSTEAVQSCG